MNSVQYNKKSQ